MAFVALLQRISTAISSALCLCLFGWGVPAVLPPSLLPFLIHESLLVHPEAYVALWENHLEPGDIPRARRVLEPQQGEAAVVREVPDVPRDSRRPELEAHQGRAVGENDDVARKLLARGPELSELGAPAGERTEIPN